MKAALCNQTLENALTAYPALEGAVIHSDYAEENTMPKFCIKPYTKPKFQIFSA